MPNNPERLSLPRDFARITVLNTASIAGIKKITPSICLIKRETDIQTDKQTRRDRERETEEERHIQTER